MSRNCHISFFVCHSCIPPLCFLLVLVATFTFQCYKTLKNDFPTATNNNCLNAKRVLSKRLMKTSPINVALAHNAEIFTLDSTHTNDVWMCVCSRVINRYAYILRLANCTKWAHKYLSKNTQTWSWNMQKLAQFARFFEEKVMYVHRTHTYRSVRSPSFTAIPKHSNTEEYH